MTSTRFKQKGAGSLLVTVLLLLGASIVVLYLNRSIIFEQKTSANQYRSTAAMEVAEAGLEWALGMLNNPEILNASCALGSGTDLSFRERYIQFSTAIPSAAPVVTAASPGCRILGGTLACACPDAGAAALSNAVTPSFTVSFASVPISDDPAGNSVRITSVGCTASAAACTAASAAQADATATVSAIVKLRPLMLAGPSAPLTCGTSCEVGGSYNIVNQSMATNGILVNAGTTITTGSGTEKGLVTLPGVPVENALVGNDASLSALSGADKECKESAVFNAYFGTTIEEYAKSALVKTITCGSTTTCGDLSLAEYAKGWRHFYFPTGVDYNNSSGFTSLGTKEKPVTIVTPEHFNINGNITINGVIFSNSSAVNDVGTGTANINGALITCAGYKNNGSGTLTYDEDIVLGRNGDRSAAVKVPGSWRDFQ